MIDLWELIQGISFVVGFGGLGFENLFLDDGINENDNERYGRDFGAKSVAERRVSSQLV
jgi:hypothetical protein